MRKVKLGDIVNRIKEPVDKDNTDLIYYIGGEHYDNGALTITRKGLIKGSTIGPAFSTQFKSGDVLLMSRNPHLRKAGMVNFDGVCSDVSYIIRTRDENVLMQKFLPILFQSDTFWEFAEKHKKGSTNFFLNWSDFEKFEFYLPEIKTQKKLCDLLWSVNDTLDSYKELLKLSDEIVKAKFVEIFDGNTFEKLRIDESCDEFLDGDWIESKDQSSEEIWLIQTGNIGDGFFIPKAEKKHYISEKTFKKLHCKEVCERDILVSRLPEPVGRACIIPKLNCKCITAVDCTIIRLKDFLLPEYFIAYTQTFEYKSQLNVTGATRQRVSRKNLGKILIPIPPKELQYQFADFVNRLNKIKSNLHQCIEKLEKLYKSILNQHFTEEDK